MRGQHVYSREEINLLARIFIRDMERSARANHINRNAIYVVRDDHPFGSGLRVEARRGLLWGWWFRWEFRGEKISRRRAVKIMEKHW